MEYTEYIIVHKCLLVGGIINVLIFIIIIHFTRKSRQWPTTKGKILSSIVSSSSWDYEGPSQSHKAIVKYQYQVQDKVYVSNRLHYGDWIETSFSSYAKSVVKRYNVGCECIVHYNPQKPQISILETKLSLSIYLLLACGILFFMVSFTLFLCRGMFAF